VAKHIIVTLSYYDALMADISEHTIRHNLYNSMNKITNTVCSKLQNN